MTLIDIVRSLVEAERGLTEALDTTRPLLRRSECSSVLSSQLDPPLIPTPRNSDEVRIVLAVARAYSLRTSAPPMWNPNLPVFGFATPNPLPHQLRGGALGAMQLKMAREERNRKGKEIAERTEKERKDKIYDEEKKKSQKEKQETRDELDINDGSPLVGEKRKLEEKTISTDGMRDPKKFEMLEIQRRHTTQVSAKDGQKIQYPLGTSNDAANMNLSDSSSSGGDESDEEG